MFIDVYIQLYGVTSHQIMTIQSCRNGRLAQLVERTLSMREVGGSNPSLSKKVAVWRNWTAHLTTDQEVPGSSPGMVVIGTSVLKLM